MSFNKTILLAAALAASASAHMKMANPAPYGAASLNNFPLDASGADFPCKIRPGGYDPPKSTATMPVGAKQTLQLQGGATHGGGSCQISLTKDLKPTKSSKWMVIHSIEGGCPNAAPGNFGDDAAAMDPTTFEYTIPDGIAPGDYALAWTWFNFKGNREMYMNCAPIVVTGGGKKARNVIPEITTAELEASLNGTQAADFNLVSRADATFPDMFVANVPATDCTTTEGSDVQFPDPGQSLVKTSQSLKPPTGPKCGAAGSSASSSSGSGAAPAAAPSAAAPAPAPAAPAPASPGTATILASPSPSAAPAAAPSVAPPAAPAPAPAPAPAAGSSSGGCTPGQIVCSPDGLQIGECGPTGSAVMGPVAGGTKCVEGKVAFARRDRVVRI